MMVSDKVLITGLITLGVLQIAAFYFGIDGTFRTLVAIIIAGTVGIQIPKEKIMGVKNNVK